MYLTHGDTWFRTLRFTQRPPTQTANGSASVSTRYESVRSTASGTRLRIDVDDPANGEGVLYTADSLRVVRVGQTGILSNVDLTPSTSGTGKAFTPSSNGIFGHTRPTLGPGVGSLLANSPDARTANNARHVRKLYGARQSDVVSGASLIPSLCHPHRKA